MNHNEAHEYDGACMKSQHKTLQNGTGVVKGWIPVQSISKAQYVMNGRSGRGGRRRQYGGQRNGGGSYQNNTDKKCQQGVRKQGRYM